MNNKVLYFHINPNTDKIFYVGMGYKNRAFDYKKRGPYWRNYVQKYNITPETMIVFENISKEEAVNWEKFYIKLFGRRDNNTGILVNLTDGGEGGSHTLTEEQKERMKISNKNKATPEAKVKQRQWHVDNPWRRNSFSEYCKQQKGKKHPRVTKFIDQNCDKLLYGISEVAEHLNISKAVASNYLYGKNKDGVTPRHNPTTIRKVLS